MSVGSFLCYTLPANMFRINVWFFRGSLMESPNGPILWEWLRLIAFAVKQRGG